MPSRTQAWRQANPEKYAAQLAAYRARPEVKAAELARAEKYRKEAPQKARDATVKWRLKTGYKTQPRRRELAELAAGRPRPKSCEVCGSAGRICWDHSHATEKFRGWICNNCNTALGMAHDNPVILRALAAYLEGNCGTT